MSGMELSADEVMGAIRVTSGDARAAMAFLARHDATDCASSGGVPRGEVRLDGVGRLAHDLCGADDPEFIAVGNKPIRLGASLRDLHRRRDVPRHGPACAEALGLVGYRGKAHRVGATETTRAVWRPGVIA